MTMPRNCLSRGYAFAPAVRVAAACVAALAGVAPAAAVAAEWIPEASVDLASFHDDNPLLTTGAHESTSGYVVVPRFNVKRNTETSKLAVNSYLAHTQYSRGDIDDQNETELRLTGENQTTERNTLGIDGQLRRDTLFQRVDIGSGVGNLRDTDIGLSSSTLARRTYTTLAPFFKRLLTERDALRVAYRLTDVTFDDAAGTGLVDYKEHLASAEFSHQLSEKDSFTVAANVARYRPSGSSTKADTLQLLAGISRNFTEATRGYFSVGGSETNQTDQGQEARSSGVVFITGFEQKSDLSTFEGVLSRDVTPSGIGRSVQTDQLRVRWTRKTAPTVDFALQAQLFRNQVLEGTAPDVDRRYYQVEPELRWHWLDHWIMSGSYRYRQQKFDVDPSAAKSNTVYLALTYTFF